MRCCQQDFNKAVLELLVQLIEAAYLCCNCYIPRDHTAELFLNNYGMVYTGCQDLDSEHPIHPESQ